MPGASAGSPRSMMLSRRLLSLTCRNGDLERAIATRPPVGRLIRDRMAKRSGDQCLPFGQSGAILVSLHTRDGSPLPQGLACLPSVNRWCRGSGQSDLCVPHVADDHGSVEAISADCATDNRLTWCLRSRCSAVSIAAAGAI